MADYAKTGSQDFGDLLRRARERRGMSRKDLAVATDLSYPYISQLETGYRQPSPAAIKKLAIALQISLDEMFAAMEGPPVKRDGSPLVRTRSDWIPNENFSRQEIARQPSREFSGAAFAPPPAARQELFAPFPEPPSDVHDVDADANDGLDTLSEKVEEIMDALSPLSPTERLEAITLIQARVIQDVIDDGIRRRRRP